MKLTTVISSVNNNPNYYKFIPKQILFWEKFGIKFIALFVGETIPNELIKYTKNIILWNKNLDINTAFVGQNLRMYYTALLKLPDNEMVMITDMDMLPINPHYFTNGLQNFTKNDFIYYRHIYYSNKNEIFMCYNASHPETWAKLFKINSEQDIANALYNSYPTDYNGTSNEHWMTDQHIMYNVLHKYENLKILDRPIRRLECSICKHYINTNNKKYLHLYDDAHFHRNYENNIDLILDVERQFLETYQ